MQGAVGCCAWLVAVRFIDLLYKIEAIPELKKEEKEDARRFRKAMTDLHEAALMSTVVSKFEHHPPEYQYNFKDYMTLRQTVLAYNAQAKENQKAKKQGVWEDAVNVANPKVKGLGRMGKDTSIDEIRNFYRQDRSTARAGRGWGVGRLRGGIGIREGGGYYGRGQFRGGISFFRLALKSPPPPASFCANPAISCSPGQHFLP